MFESVLGRTLLIPVNLDGVARGEANMSHFFSLLLPLGKQKVMLFPDESGLAFLLRFLTFSTAGSYF